MNTIDLLTNIIPISSALLSLIASIVVSYITKKITSSGGKGNSKMTIKLDDIELEINDKSKEEILKFITKIKDEDAFHKDSSCKKEPWIVLMLRKTDR